MTRFYSGIAGNRGSKPSGIVIHNDAGGVYANAAFYKSWLPTHEAENGFAHYYCASDGIFQAENEANMAWHCANSIGNAQYIGIEACQSMGPEATFRANEEASFKLAAEILKRYGLTANRTTVKLHKQFSSTACPHRSVDLHGDGTAVQDYFISRINSYMGRSTTTPSNPTSAMKYALDTVNVNSGAFQVVGWVTPKKACKNQDIWVYFMNAKTNTELGRFKSRKIQRPDVQKSVPNPNGADVGFQCDGATPEGILGIDYYFLLRYNNDNKEELWIKEKVYPGPKLVNAGHLDKIIGDTKGVRFAGWHLNSRNKRTDTHMIFIMDASTKKELARFDITGGSYRPSPDIVKLYGSEIAQRSTARFDNWCALPTNHKARGKKAYMISRYAPKAEIDKKTSTDIVFKEQFTL